MCSVRRKRECGAMSLVLVCGVYGFVFKKKNGVCQRKVRKLKWDKYLYSKNISKYGTKSTSVILKFTFVLQREMPGRCSSKTFPSPPRQMI